MRWKFADVEMVEKLIYQYFDAVYRADIDVLRTIFHKKAAMYGDLDGMLLAGTPEPFLEDLLSGPSMQTQNIVCRAMITYLEVSGSVASVTLLVDNYYGQTNVRDHFHLMRENDEWKIVCKTFTTLS